MAQLMPLPLAVSGFSKIQIGFTFLVLAHPGNPGKRAIKRVCVCVLIVFLYNACILLLYVVTAFLSVKRICYLQNRKYIMYRYAARGGTSDVPPSVV